jgi:rod shape-determining protein MreB
MSRFSVLASKALQSSQGILPTSSAGGVIAIDFGSSFTRIKIGSKVVFDQPSCVAFHPSTGTVLAVGQACYNMLGKANEQVNVVFPVRRGKIADLTAAQQLLAAALQPFLPKLKFLQPLVMRQVKLAVPANSTPAQRSFFRQALSVAGYFRLEYEYKVAAIAQTVSTKQAQLIIDVGGQTTEVAICQENQVLIKKNNFIRWR